MKLIRDNYATIINPNCMVAVTEEEALELAIAKIDEELQELKDSNFEDINEFADVFEILLSVAERKGFGFDQLWAAKSKKFFEKGGFGMNLALKGCDDDI